MTLDTAMADGATMLHERLFTEGLKEEPTKPSNVAAA